MIFPVLNLGLSVSACPAWPACPVAPEDGTVVAPEDGTGVGSENRTGGICG